MFIGDAATMDSTTVQTIRGILMSELGIPSSRVEVANFVTRRFVVGGDTMCWKSSHYAHEGSPVTIVTGNRAAVSFSARGLGLADGT